MRQITKESVNAFLNKQNLNKQNMSIFYSNSQDTSYMALHGNTIAIYQHFNNVLKISNCGWQSNTTKERLNALPDVDIRQKTLFGILMVNNGMEN